MIKILLVLDHSPQHLSSSNICIQIFSEGNTRLQIYNALHFFSIVLQVIVKLPTGGKNSKKSQASHISRKIMKTGQMSSLKRHRIAKLGLFTLAERILKGHDKIYD